MPKGSPKPLAAHKRVSTIAMVTSFIAFILLLLTGLSLTIIKPIYLLVVRAADQPETSVASELRFGVWGVCATGGLNEPTAFTNNGRCFGPKLGFDIPPYIFELVKIPSAVSTAVLHAILVILILHIVGAGLAVLTFILSLFLASHPMAILALVSAFLTAIATTITLAIDISLVLVAKNKIQETAFAGTLEVEWGNGVWIALAGTVLTWITVLLLCARVCYCCGVRPQGRMHHHHPSHSSHSSFQGY